MCVSYVCVSVSVSVYMFEKLQLDGIQEELSHGTGAMVHKGFLTECNRLTLNRQERKSTVMLLYSTFGIIQILVPSSPSLQPCYNVTD